MPERMDIETLAAFVDGELAPEDAARVVMHLADCPEDQAWVDLAMRANELLGKAYSAPMDEPVPDRFRDLILPRPTTPVAADGGTVVPFVRRMALPLATAALAAAASVMVMLSLGPRETANAPLVAGRVAQHGAIHAALDALDSGATRQLPNGRQLAMMASFQDGRGGYCREFQVTAAPNDGFDHAVACRAAEGWNVEIVVHQIAEADGGDGGYRPAGGAGSRAIERLLDDIGAGMVLTAEEEAAARGSGWRQ
jgi:hypothetical protein